VNVASRVRRALFVAVVVTGGVACGGDSTPAAGRCIVAFQALAELFPDDDNDSRGLAALERTLYWCGNQERWGQGLRRVDAFDLQELEDELVVRDALGFICDGEYRSSPVCQDALMRGPLPNPFEGF
jgi:hypothetical protein